MCDFTSVLYEKPYEKSQVVKIANRQKIEQSFVTLLRPAWALEGVEVSSFSADVVSGIDAGLHGRQI